MVARQRIITLEVPSLLVVLALSGGCNDSKPEQSMQINVNGKGPDAKQHVINKEVAKKGESMLVSGQAPTTLEVSNGQLCMPLTEAQKILLFISKDKGLPMLEKAWGKPIETEKYGKKVYWGFNSKAGVRAALTENLEDDVDIEFTAYVPYKKFLGEGSRLAFLDKGDVFGSNVDEIRTKYPDEFHEDSKERAEEEHKQLEGFTGQDLDVIRQNNPDVYLDFPPTEWGSYWTRVHLDFNDQQKNSRLWFGIDYEAHPPSKEEILAFLKQKWGEPKEIEKLGQKRYVFTHNLFAIEAGEDTISHQWDIFVELKAG